MSWRPPPARGLTALCAALAGSALVAACAAGPAQRAGLRPSLTSAEPAKTSPYVETALGPQSSLYGLFLAGQAALEKGSSREAALYLGRASQLAPDAPFLKERAFTAALIAGEVEKAASLAPGPGEGTPATQRLGQLTRAIDLMARGKGAEATALLASAPTQGSTGAAILLMRGWAAAMAGDWRQATIAETSESQVTRLLAALSRARLLERAGQMAEADAAFKTANAQANNGLFALAYGGFLERRGRRAEAVAVYDKSLAQNRDAGLEFARARARAGRGAPGLGSLQAGAAEALLAPAALQISRRQPETALALLRLTLRLDPDQDEAWMLVGDAMESAGDRAASRDAYRRVRSTSFEYDSAQNRLAWSLQSAGDPEGALELARSNIDRSKGSAQSLTAYADLLRENARYVEAAEVLDKLIENGGADVDAWRLYYLRGVSLERSGRWDRAESDLQKALSLRPEDPDILNYLGFGWADRGQRLSEALALLEKAAALRPRSGAIRDSLGWARFRLGQYPEAVGDLERAVSLAPADPAVNDHLGDAYLQVGRALEAEYQWRRVLTLDPDEALRQAVEAKLKSPAQAAGGTIALVDTQR